MSAESLHLLKPLLLGPPRWTLAIAESLTCGQVQARVGAISGASHFLLGGMTAYTIEQKVRHLGVDENEARRTDAVAESVARQMARGALALFGSDVAVATTGFAETPPAGRGDTPFAWWALQHGPTRTERSGRIEYPGAARGEVQARVADAVLEELIRLLRELRAGSGAAPASSPPP